MYAIKTLNKAVLSLAIRYRSEDLKHLILGKQATRVTGLAYIFLFFYQMAALLASFYKIRFHTVDIQIPHTQVSNLFDYQAVKCPF